MEVPVDPSTTFTVASVAGADDSAAGSAEAGAAAEVDFGANSSSISSASVLDGAGAAGAGAGTDGAGVDFFSAGAATGMAVVESSFFPILKLGAAADFPATPPPPILRLAAGLGLSPPILKLAGALAPPPILRLAAGLAPPIDSEGDEVPTGGPGVKLGGVKPLTERGSYVLC